MEDKQRVFDWVNQNEKRVKLTELEKSLNPDDWFDEKYLFWIDFDDIDSVNVVRVCIPADEEWENVGDMYKRSSLSYKKRYYWFYENFGLNMLGYSMNDLNKCEDLYYGYSLMNIF